MRKQYNLFKRAQNIIVNSQYTKNDFIKYLDIDENRMDVVYPAINNEIFYPGKSNLRESLNINNEDILLLNVAPDSKHNKNVITVLKVLRTLPQNYKLIRIGNNSNTLNLIKEWNLEERVILFENIDSKKLGEVYRASDVFIFPSLFEGFGSPVMEAMASGLPVIVSNRTSLPEVAGNAGLIFDPYDIEGMKEAILKITKDTDLYESFRKISIERAKIFSYENQFKSLMDVFEKFTQTK
jgi:glycosyltransferase involved in cell wall biosynthesis